MSLEDLPPSLALSLIALELPKYLLRIPLALGLFFTAINVEKVVTRAIALAMLVILGVTFLLVGLGHKTVVDLLIGIAGIGAAVYAWWWTKV